MTLQKYLSMMAFATLICWGAWVAVINMVDVQHTGLLGYVLFYVSLFFALTGTFAVIGFFVRLVLLKQELVFQKVVTSFRQAIFFSLLIDGLLLLASRNLLRWYNVMFLVIGLTIAEFFMISRTPRYRG
ncbi:MAG: hypothetical protein Q8P11_04015 [bacterium]|nr:hypothetical protein [bacterium]